MPRNISIENYQEYYEAHRDYFVLMEEYFHLEIYKEIIQFMNLAFPEWKSNRGIGAWAAEFILTNIQSLDYFDEIENYTSLDKLKDCYLSLSEEYTKTKPQYKLVIEQLVLKSYQNENEELLMDDDSLSNSELDSLFMSFREKYLNKIIYNFEEFNVPKTL